MSNRAAYGNESSTTPTALQMPWTGHCHRSRRREHRWRAGQKLPCFIKSRGHQASFLLNEDRMELREALVEPMLLAACDSLDEQQWGERVLVSVLAVLTLSCTAQCNGLTTSSLYMPELLPKQT
eukprot:CAMPEP_0204465714 /NCGR_PEP_ID=MMETSP0471-20130131/8582_1 /ASSEMBLY_ACC=CAM_ASM_000602 /TAXON_ID=2969 /ORGANISM="Oxyrrhis marina" /LENGTH=123 /DNA_ID=CAMNT_0051467273 /DNA_START=95 /DNA_END=464 /DNA_ORIENTATION=+